MLFRLRQCFFPVNTGTVFRYRAFLNVVKAVYFAYVTGFVSSKGLNIIKVKQWQLVIIHTCNPVPNIKETIDIHFGVLLMT